MTYGGDVEEELNAVLKDMATESALLWLFVLLGNAATILGLVGSLGKEVDPLEGVTQIV